MKEEPIIIADRDKISHIYFNLMSNALKYTPEGGSITTSLAYANHTYTIKVSDTGKGVAEDELPRLFERFYQARGAEGGTGIGLSLVKAFVELHNGKVHAESKEGKGVTIVVSLPDSQPGYDPAKDVEEKPTAEKGLIDDNYVTTNISAKESADRITNAEDFDHDRPLVLIIDDNDGMRSYLHSILKQKYNISEAANDKVDWDRLTIIVAYKEKTQGDEIHDAAPQNMEKRTRKGQSSFSIIPLPSPLTGTIRYL